ncbi:MAG: hypothetical protein IJF48_00920 [Clostridia bacterium]|nr:hypothetical protein [Clostridia bacterium]
MKTKTCARRLTLITLITALAIPLINTVGVWSLYKIFDSDIAYPVWSSSLTYYIYSALNVLCTYAVALCVAYSTAARVRRLPTVLIAAASAVIVYTATVAVDVAFYGTGALDASYIRYNAVLCLYELLRLGAVMLTAALLSRRARGKKLFWVCTASTLVVFAFTLVSSAADTVSILLQAAQVYSDWGPKNISEWMTLLMPYVTAVIYALAGYLVSRALLLIIERKTLIAGNSENEVNI